MRLQDELSVPVPRGKAYGWMKSLTALHSLRGFAGSGWQVRRQPQAMVELVIQG